MSRTRAFVALVALLYLARASARQADVVYQEPDLSLHYANDIHPYAWSAMRPDPYYVDTMNAYSVGDDRALESFLDTQTHLTAKSPQASTLLEVKEDLSLTSSRGIFGKLGNLAKKGLNMVTGGLAGKAISAVQKGAKGLTDPMVDPKGWSTQTDKKDENNPASGKVREMQGIRSDFKLNPDRAHTTGSFPGANHWRRAQWGLRRRRLPYFSKSEGFGSANPYRKSNHFFNAPNDLLSPNARDSPIRNPAAFDFGPVAAGEPRLPYAGYSSFHARRVRANQDGRGGSPSFPPVPDVRFADAGIRMGDSPPILSDGSPAHFRHTQYPGASSDFFTGGKNMRWDGDKYTPTSSPLFGGVSPYIPTMGGQFFDFYGGGGGGEGAGGEGSGAL